MSDAVLLYLYLLFNFIIEQNQILHNMKKQSILAVFVLNIKIQF